MALIFLRKTAWKIIFLSPKTFSTSLKNNSHRNTQTYICRSLTFKSWRCKQCREVNKGVVDFGVSATHTTHTNSLPHKIKIAALYFVSNFRRRDTILHYSQKIRDAHQKPLRIVRFGVEHFFEYNAYRTRPRPEFDYIRWQLSTTGAKMARKLLFWPFLRVREVAKPLTLKRWRGGRGTGKAAHARAAPYVWICRYGFFILHCIFARKIRILPKCTRI